MLRLLRQISNMKATCGNRKGKSRNYERRSRSDCLKPWNIRQCRVCPGRWSKNFPGFALNPLLKPAVFRELPLPRYRFCFSISKSENHSLKPLPDEYFAAVASEFRDFGLSLSSS